MTLQSEPHRARRTKTKFLASPKPDAHSSNTEQEDLCVHDWIVSLRELSETLPLPFDQYELVQGRLENAQCYLNNNNLSAARFEIKHVVATLKKNFPLPQLLGLWADRQSKG